MYYCWIFHTCTSRTWIVWFNIWGSDKYFSRYKKLNFEDTKQCTCIEKQLHTTYCDQVLFCLSAISTVARISKAPTSCMTLITFFRKQMGNERNNKILKSPIPSTMEELRKDWHFHLKGLDDTFMTRESERDISEHFSFGESNQHWECYQSLKI